jgi:hypothetical protein
LGVAALAAALFWRSGFSAATLGVAGVGAIHCFLVGISAPASRLRLVTNFVLLWVIYGGCSSIIEALGLPVHQRALLAADRWLFGETPSVAWSAHLTGWMADVLSAAYLSYQVYLHWAFIEAWFRDETWRLRFGRCIFPAFAVGFVGYFLFPAACPNVAFPELYAQAIPGGWIPRFNESLNASLAARYDAFPSLHVLITLTLLAFDARLRHPRFWIMLVPSLLMGVATLALRLHYAVDVLAAVAIFLGMAMFSLWSPFVKR